MKKNLIQIKQVANTSAKIMGADVKGVQSGFGEFTAYPETVRSYVAERGMDRTFNTGLTPEETERYQRLLGVDLTATSSFWETFRLYFTMPDGTMYWNLNKPEDYIKYKLALANKFLAPDRDTIKDDADFLTRDIYYYVFDPEEEENKVTMLNEIKDEISSLLYKARNNRDKLLYLCSGLNKFVSANMKAEHLYNTLSNEKNKLNKLPALEQFRDFLKSSPEKLQAMYFVKEALTLRILKFEPDINKYRFPLPNLIVGANTKEVEDFFTDPKNAEYLATLANEVLDARK